MQQARSGDSLSHRFSTSLFLWAVRRRSSRTLARPQSTADISHRSSYRLPCSHRRRTSTHRCLGRGRARRCRWEGQADCAPRAGTTWSQRQARDQSDGPRRTTRSDWCTNYGRPLPQRPHRCSSHHSSPATNTARTSAPTSLSLSLALAMALAPGLLSRPAARGSAARQCAAGCPQHEAQP